MRRAVAGGGLLRQAKLEARDDRRAEQLEYQAAAGYNLCTGIGSPLGFGGL
jgi:hypothetical protein